MKRLRQHNEWFRPVAQHRKSCKTCHIKFQGKEHQWSWGEYIRGKWYTVAWFCRSCYRQEVINRLSGHADMCGCTINLVGRYEALPSWLTL